MGTSHRLRELLGVCVVFTVATAIGTSVLVGRALAAPGDPLWERHYEGSVFGAASAYSVATDPYGNIYTVGRAAYRYTGYDMVIIKYSATGRRLWVRRYSGSGRYSDAAKAVRVYRGGVYVTGVRRGRTGPNCVTLKYDAYGRRKWVAAYDVVGRGLCEGRAIAVDARCNAYVAGNTRIGSTNYAVLLKYNIYGRRAWSKRLRGALSEMVADSGGNCYVAGSGAGTMGYPFYMVEKYSPGGVRRWSALGPDFSRARAVALDGDKVTIVGDAVSGGFAAQYSTSGVRQWEHESAGRDYADVASRNGSVYVAATKTVSVPETHSAILLVMYRMVGGSLARTERDMLAVDDPQLDMTARAVTTDAGGNVYAIGDGSTTDGAGEPCSNVFKADANLGSILWNSACGMVRVHAVVCSSKGGVHTAGAWGTSGTPEAMSLIKHEQ